MFGWPESASHRVALAQKTLPVSVVEIRSEHLDGDASPEGLLVAAIDDPAAAPANFDGVVEPGGCQLRRYPARHVAHPSVNFRYFAPKVPSKDTTSAALRFVASMRVRSLR